MKSLRKILSYLINASTWHIEPENPFAQLYRVLHEVSYPKKGDKNWRPTHCSPALQWRHDWQGHKPSGSWACIQAIVWVLPSFHRKRGPLGWNEAVRTIMNLLSTPISPRKNEYRFFIQTQLHERECLYIVKHSKVHRRRQALRTSPVHMHDGRMLITWSHTVSFHGTPTFSTQDNGAPLMSSYVIFCFHVVVLCVALCFLFCTLFNPALKAVINALKDFSMATINLSFPNFQVLSFATLTVFSVKMVCVMPHIFNARF